MGERFIAPESLTVDVWAISDQNAIKPTVNYMPVTGYSFAANERRATGQVVSHRVVVSSAR